MGKEGDRSKNVRIFSSSGWSGDRKLKGSSFPGVLVLFSLDLTLGVDVGCGMSSFGFLGAGSDSSRLLLAV